MTIAKFLSGSLKKITKRRKVGERKQHIEAHYAKDKRIFLWLNG
jgi:hypothetical protein